MEMLDDQGSECSPCSLSQTHTSLTDIIRGSITIPLPAHTALLHLSPPQIS